MEQNGKYINSNKKKIPIQLRRDVVLLEKT